MEEVHVDIVVLEQGRVLVEEKLGQVEGFVVKGLLIGLKFVGGFRNRLRYVLFYLVGGIFLHRLIISLQLLN